MPSALVKFLSLIIPLILSFFGIIGGIISGDDNQFTFSVDASKTGATLSNPVSNVNVWSIEGNPFVNATKNEENNIFDFVEYVQFMQCTGGTETRDLFKDPLDRTVLDAIQNVDNVEEFLKYISEEENFSK